MHIDVDQFPAHYGLPVVFGAVFVEQMGVPIPALPWLLAHSRPLLGGIDAWREQNYPVVMVATLQASSSRLRDLRSNTHAPSD